MFHLLSKFILPLVILFFLACDASVLQGLRDARLNVTPDDFDYRRAINITNGGSAQSSYQIKVQLSTATMGSPYDRVRSNGSDIRFFTESDDMLDYWIESFDNTGDSFVWVKVSNVPSGSSTIYMYYGNDDVSSDSSGSNTFLFYDDFDDHSAGQFADGWSPSTYTIVNDAGNMVLSDGAGSEEDVTATHANYADVAVRQKMRSFSGTLDYSGCLLRWGDSNHMVYGGMAQNNTAQIWQISTAGGWEQIGGDWNPSVTGWFIQELCAFGSVVSLYVDNVLIGDGTITEPTIPTSGRTGFWSQYNGEVGYIDWQLVRKFSSPEPGITVGSEELN